MEYLKTDRALFPWKIYFCPNLQKNIEVFYKLILSVWVCITRHTQSTQNKFAYLCNISRKTWGTKLIFLHADKHESLLQTDTVILMVMVKHSQSSQNRKLAMSFQYLRKEVKDEVNFLHVDKRQSFLQFDFNTLGIKVFFSTRWYCHYWWTWSSILKVLKKEVRNAFHSLQADKQHFYRLKLSFLIEVTRNVESTQIWKLVIFSQYLQKNVSQLLLCSIVMVNNQRFSCGPVMFVVTCFHLIFFADILLNYIHI